MLAEKSGYFVFSVPDNVLSSSLAKSLRKLKSQRGKGNLLRRYASKKSYTYIYSEELPFLEFKKKSELSYLQDPLNVCLDCDQVQDDLGCVLLDVAYLHPLLQRQIPR